MLDKKLCNRVDTRTKLLDFLQWNDRNGTYLDDDCISEGYTPFTFMESLKIFVHVMSERDGGFDDVNITKEFARVPKIKKALFILLKGNMDLKTYRTVVEVV